MNSTPETFTSADGTTIAFERTGDGPPVVLIGGAFSDRGSAAELAAVLASGLTAVTYDRRGRGDSTNNDRDYSVQREIEDIAGLIERLGGGWELALDARRLLKTYAFRDFAEGLGFVNLVGALAESVNHHPDLYLAWGRVRVEIWTHKIDGLTESDFVFAAKCDALLT